MPKPTFFHLPAAKRDRIVALAVEEFGSRPFRQASLSRIVARAGIAKGSIYQYFQNKLDLYQWLLQEHLVQAKMAAIVACAPPPEADIWAELQAAVVAGIRFSAEHPELSRLGVQFMRDAGEPAIEAIAAAHRAAGQAWTRALLERGIAQGVVRPDADLAVAAPLVALLGGEGVVHLIASELGIGVDQFLSQPALVRDLPEARRVALAGRLITFLKRGLAPVENDT